MTITPDVRLEYLESVASVVLKFKPDKWSKMIGAEENMALLTEFFEKPDVLVLVLTLSPAGMIIPCLGFPASLKSKGLYFIKKKPENISKDNYKDRLVYGDISPTPVDQLIAIVEEVLYSLLNQSASMSGWPRVVSEDIVKQVHKLKNEMFVMSGKIKGRTLLPVPEHLGSLHGTLESMERIPASLDNSLLHAIETIIIDWSHQIRDVLSKDSAQALLDGLHPLPRVEFEFWDARLMNLKCIHDQLNRPKVNKIVEILEKAKSCYWPALQNVYTNVTEGLKEANDIVLYLKPLQILLEEMEQADFTMLPTFITKVLYTICFIWATSEHYNTPSRIIVILQEFCNQLIEMTRAYLSPDEVLKGLQGEIEEVLSGISLSVSVLKELYRAYDFCCANMKLFFKKDKEPVPWEFPSSLAFSRINSFFHRVQTIEDLYKTAIEFLKLEKIELGGVRGNILGSQVIQIYDEVFELVKVFADCKYDPLDPGDSSFDDDYADFETKIQDLDRRLATIFCQGFDDCSSIESCAKLLHMCGGLLERPLILAEVVPRYSVMLELFDAELDNTKILYDAQIAASADGNIPSIHKNMPPVAGQLKWSLELQERLEAPMRDLKHIEHPVMSSVEAKLIYQKYDEMMELLRSYRERIYRQWVVGVDQDCQFNLGQPLIQRDPVTNLVRVNFSRALVAVLREVKYLNFQQQKEIPSSAENLFSKYETFRKFVGNLELIVSWYNEIKTTVKDVEFPLIKSELQAIDVKLLDAETTLFWNGEGVFEYIQEMREILYNLQNRIQKAKQNIEGISQAMKDWSANPMFERKDNKKEALLDLDGRVVNLSKRYTAVKDAGLKIQSMVAENAELLRADTTSQSWKDYVNYIDSVVLDEFDRFICKSLNYLIDNMFVEESVAPLFEIRMELDEDGLVFSPSLEVGGDRGFLALIGSLVTDIYNAAKLIPRLAKGRMNYKTDLEDMTDLIEMREEISSLVVSAMKEAEEYQDSFERYSYLWMDDPQEFMKNFLIYGRAVSPEDLDTRAEETLPKTPPTLTQFQQQIDSYEKLYEEVSTCENTKVFNGWLQCDCRPFKQALLNTVKRWSLMFKRHLSNHVINSLADLEAFMKVARAGLTKPLKEGDYDGLVEVMGHLMKVKERQMATDNMFEPLKQTIELLKSYGEEMPEETHVKLQELPEQWTNTKKLAIQVKQNVAPLQANEVSILRRKCQQFELRQHEFREKFRQEAPFSFSDPDPYKSLNKQQESIAAMEGIMEALCKSGSLFEVTVPDYKQLKACHKEVRLLKELWDMIFMVNSSIDDWKTTKWKNINVEQMDIDCKKFAKDVRSLDKEMKSWDAFVGLDNTVKNMTTSLRAVSELQNPAIRDRHWQQLMQATQVKFEMSDETTLADLLQLNLHKYEDEVRNIVDKAVKESGMEKVLKALDSTWSTMEFEHELHPRTGTVMLKSDEVLVETLEDNQVQLQNLMMSKYLSHFLKEVTSWQQKLSAADSVISIWFEVQRTWSHLESIFIGSEDIRAQLPEDSRRFDDIDQEFKALMEEAVKTPNVVEATNKPGLYDKLENLKKRLAVCEKALAEYLETKRLAFPRFYFVSSADLLDILSNGNDPVEVSRHLSKLFDSLCKLKFRLDGDGKPLKFGLGMYSKEDEYVDFDRECDLSGQVEVWLNRVLDRMCATLRHEIPEAVVTYEEKPREQWIFDYPAQIALTCTQIWWTTEVGLAFARLEEGYENAIKDYNKKQISQLNALITLLIGNLDAGDRMKVMTICTIDVHARDVVAKMITAKVESSQAFTWQSQLRHRWDEEKKHCFANICDAQIQYSYEYLGNTPRLVITPLTDRCYITLTQSLHLIMGGAPAGPAGTGKTETTKDLGRALGTMVYVFNCSEQMDYKSCGNIYKGLAQTGAWGCFDEFNRISVEVLSVIAVQVKCIQDAIRAKKKTFNFLGETISLTPTVGLFITMNPGYAGRTELPENLKALFRPCAMVVPDFELICEIMLVAEGFLEARLLARKFITLYTLCKELLSKQDHYDWGLRAIKSVLVVAGSLKRGDPSRAEDQVLMRALRDFNIPKIVTDDLPVFMGLIGDLFPALDVPRKRDLNFEKVIKQSIVELRLQAEDSFVLKVVQLEELLQVRHSVFVIGNAGSGKSQVLKSLNKTYQNLKRKPVAVDLDPKAVTCDELFGIINPATREWKDGLFSTIMRDLANITHDGPKWIVLDGDIDPMWIESLNTVMDDNKVLTLASNERIPLNRTMRLVFEISHLRTATPATVSRAGILYINPADLGWNPVVSSWIERRKVQSEKANLMILFDKYLPTCLDKLRVGFKKITPVPEITVIQMILYLLECLLTEKNAPPDSAKELYELYFVFACFWAFGGAMFQDQLIDYRVEFSRWWINEFKTIKFPSQGTIFDYYIDPDTKKFLPWTDKVPAFELDPDVSLQASLVHTTETTRIRYFMDLLMEKSWPVMLVGNAGTGKSVLMGDKLDSLSTDDYLVQAVPFNFYTTSAMLQGVLEKPLEKKSGRNYGPPGTKKLIYFIDDMNMPEVDKYGTVAPHTLIRQHMDHGHWYDRQKLTLKDVRNCQYVACMNPTAGSFTIDPRLQRHFCVFAVSFPGQEALTSIYSTILAQHLAYRSAPMGVQRMSSHLVACALALHQKVTSTFLPTAIKFHYVFNLRDLSSIFQGLLFSTTEILKIPLDLVRLWLHEAERVYGDKMVDEKDQETLRRVTVASTKKFFDDLGDELLFAKPNIYCHFAHGIGDPKYLPVTDLAPLNKLLVEVLDSYNEVNAVMNLVLFEDAVAHICRINRILESPRGNALLVGVGGSGKQSLSRLAAYISALDVFQITLKKGYGIPDLKLDLGAQYIKSAVKNVPSVFLMTDSQVAEEQFLVLINDLLASGEIPGLFTDDEMENIISSMRPQVKSVGLLDTREACWKFFIDKVRRHLKVILCFSPVGSVLRVRARKFPAVVNCTAIDWFHEWPEDALVSVSARFLEDTEGIQPEVKASISLFMSYVHTTVNEMSKVYLATERRYNYTTPKTFLEQIKLYQSLLAKKRMELVAKIERLENGLMKLQSTASQVDDLKAKLAIQEAELKQKNENADKLIHVVGVETEKVSKEKAIADEEEIKVEVINKNVTEKQKACETDLAKAEPALLAAQEALDTLNKNNLTELKSFGSPPEAVVNVTAAVMILTAPGGKIPKDKSWKAAKIMMGKVDTFLDSLKKFDKEHIPEACLKAFKPYQGNPTFDPEFIRSKSTAAAGLCSWCINIVRFYEVYCDVAPKRQALEEANAELAEAQEKLSRIKNKIAELNANLSNLTSAFEKATAEKIKCQQEADATNRVISLANRLVGGLASENVRWAESVENFRRRGITLCGDVLLISAFVSYVGYFTKKYRNELMERCWIPYINQLKVPIPITEGLDPLSLLTDDADVATWNNQGLPSDRMSTENATILCNTERWPLIVDAQLQGIKWIKNKYGSELKAIRLGQKSYLDIIERAISEGDTLLLENIGETVDPVLDPLLGRNTIKKGKFIKIGDKEVEYHPSFRLILHTKYFNPHYKPEMQAQCTLINFLVTRDGLEDQLLAAVVAKERPDLEQLKANLTKSQNEFKIVLKELEDSLLARLSAASGNFLGDTALVENLETTKHTAREIEEKVQEAKITEVKINEARENYRPAAERASLLYFILNDLNKINPIYQFSLKAFNVVFEKAIQKTAPADEVKQRVINLTDEITYSVYMYTARGLFERDKLIFLAQVAFQVLSMKKELNPVELDFLLRFPFKAGVVSPVDFLQNQGWGGIKALSEMDEFKNLDSDIEGSAKRWKKLVESEAPEKEIFPKEWKNKSALQKLCIVRCMRPDRMTYAIKNFVEEKMGSKFVEGRSVEFSKSYEESSPSTPIFFILSPGVDPLKDVEALGKKLGFTIDNGKLHNVSLGQGQEVVAENALDMAAEKGHWVILQNVHLVARWLSTLDKKLERYSSGSHDDYRVFISAEPAPSPESHIIPQGILENAIKITNEPPTGMYANLHKALDLFTQDTLEMCTKEIEFKCILFALCYFHAVVAERRKFGAQGWNRSYPFNNGDLTISINVLHNYLEANPKVPWDDLRYLFGEIMYGGHITDDWDRRLCRTYLVEYIRAEMLEGEILLAPGFQIPPNLDYKGYHEYIDENLPPESPYLYGLHPNAEIGFLTVTSEKLFRTVLEMQPKETDSGASTGVAREEKVKAVLDEILEKIPEMFNMAEIMAKAAEKTPYVVVAFQECERMNILTNEMRRSLKELNLGLKGELTITTDMEDLSTALFYDTVPDTWVARAYPSMMGLAAWYADLLLRIRELEAWTTDFALPTTVWLAGFFNPQSFLTAIMQSMARKNEWPLDKMCLSVEVTKKNREDMTAPPREGSYVYGLFMEGARWDTQTGVITEARLKELTPAMPVIFIKAIPVDRMETKNIYECPVYKTRVRGPTYVWTFNLKTKEKAAKWIVAAVALLLQV
ncbi:dynein axonemal heavy chain 17 [Hippopotamus amphibius kiboko]|uniref:dynein axonemal heavy chain 17 n=1 Tax=Hippopotamus amphibius kiboko TaxID=575201 RepID=UPI00259797B8|nr:dynein axonemal heavy chain 17 [Hippopotamus amphibius kiboko]